MSKIRNPNNGKVYEVIPGAIYPKWFEIVSEDDKIKVGEPTVTYEIIEEKEGTEQVQTENIAKANVKPKEQSKKKKTIKKAKKGTK